MLVSHQQARCGVYQYGLAMAEALKNASRYRFEYVECANATDFFAALAQIRPAAVFYNHHSPAMPWLRRRVTRRVRVPQVATIHEVDQATIDAVDTTVLPHHIALDPTLSLRNPRVFKVGRIVPDYINRFAPPALPTIGSFGFGFTGKGFERLVAQVQTEFEEAVVRLHIAFNDVLDPDGSQAIATVERCRAVLTKPGIRLEASHDFLTKSQLLDFLAQNSLNAFFYGRTNSFGISSVIDHALAVRRPIAITKNRMFRHIAGAQPTICIE
jgi:hypothetical protein